MFSHRHLRHVSVTEVVPGSWSLLLCSSGPGRAGSGVHRDGLCHLSFIRRHGGCVDHASLEQRQLGLLSGLFYNSLDDNHGYGHHIPVRSCLQESQGIGRDETRVPRSDKEVCSLKMHCYCYLCAPSTRHCSYCGVRKSGMGNGLLCSCRLDWDHQDSSFVFDRSPIDIDGAVDKTTFVHIYISQFRQPGCCPSSSLRPCCTTARSK